MYLKTCNRDEQPYSPAAKMLKHTNRTRTTPRADSSQGARGVGGKNPLQDPVWPVVWIKGEKLNNPEGGKRLLSPMSPCQELELEGTGQRHC